MNYIEDFVAAVPSANKAKYIRHATRAAAIFKQHGILQLVESRGDEVPHGETTWFPMAVKCRPDETVIFSSITRTSKQARKQGMEKAMAYPRLNPENQPMPFDGIRLIFGGFEIIVDERAR